MMIKRQVDLEEIEKLFKIFPVVAILGVRQCGKTTLAREFAYDHYFDLENPLALAKLDNPQLALEDLQGLIVIDEIQKKPELFTLLRYLVDHKPKQKYLILGSASRDLIRQSSESLAGRIGYYQLTGFGVHDIDKKDLQKLWLRGTMPRSFLARSNEESLVWRANYITTYLERDLPQLGIHIPANTLRRFWLMLAHYHGQILNYSELARSFGMSDMTVRKYLDILAGTFMVRILQPWFANVGKRTVKQPKVYLRDAGIFHSLLSLETQDQLLSHNKLGASWEGFALECVCQSIGKDNNDYYFWSTHSGAEVDFFWQHSGKNWCVEFKFQDAPIMTKSLRIVLQDLEPAHIWVLYPGKETYAIDKKVTAFPICKIPSRWQYL